MVGARGRLRLDEREELASSCWLPVIITPTMLLYLGVAVPFQSNSIQIALFLALTQPASSPSSKTSAPGSQNTLWSYPGPLEAFRAPPQAQRLALF